MEEEVSDYGYSEIKLYLLDLDQKLLGVDLAFLFELHETTLAFKSAG